MTTELLDKSAAGAGTGTAALEAVSLARAFGGLRAVDGVSLTVHPGQVVGLIGPNGAGKTTTINLISGLLAVTEGTIRIAGADATTASAPTIAGLGLARTFQTSRLFADLSVEQNVQLARLFGEGRSGAGPRTGLRAAPSARRTWSSPSRWPRSSGCGCTPGSSSGPSTGTAPSGTD